MKIRNYREKIVVFMFSIILVMGMAACSSDTNGGTDSGAAVEPMITAEAPQETAALKSETPATTETENLKPEVGKTETTASEDNGNEYSDAEEISVGDPLVGIVDRFADDLIVIIDTNDSDLVYYFSTKNAQVVEGDSPISAGDMVEITYRGVMGDEGHPGEAVKVVAESMMYQ